MPKAVIINGSPNPASRLTGIIQYLERELIRRERYGGLVSVAGLPAEDLILGRYDSPDIVQAHALVESAETVIVASPVYKASYTGVLKTYLDLLPQKGLAGKTVLPIFIGGSLAHLLTIDYAFKPVAAALGARHFASSVYVVDTWITRIEKDGAAVFELHDELKRRLDETLEELESDLGVKTHA